MVRRQSTNAVCIATRIDIVVKNCRERKKKRVKTSVDISPFG